MNNKERDMFYSNYGYTNAMPNMMPNMMPNNMMPNNMIPISNNDLDKRLTNIENNIKKLNARVSKLENPYGNNTYNEPDNNMYMI